MPIHYIQNECGQDKNHPKHTLEIVTENRFFADFKEVNIKISCNDDATVRSFKLRKYSCKFVNKLSVVFIDVTRWSINIIFLAHIGERA